jgi:hypothetical protein
VPCGEGTEQGHREERHQKPPSNECDGCLCLAGISSTDCPCDKPSGGHTESPQRSLGDDGGGPVCKSESTLSLGTQTPGHPGHGDCCADNPDEKSEAVEQTVSR